MESEKHRRVRDWLKKSGYGLEMRVAAECRKHWLPTTQSVSYVDPTQAKTIREADVVVRFVRLNGDGDVFTLGAVIECKSSMAKPWVALVVQDTVTGRQTGLTRSPPFSSTDFYDEEWMEWLYDAWAGFAPFGQASSADALVAAHEQDQKSDYNTAASALRQAMSAAAGIDQQVDLGTLALDFVPNRHLLMTLPVLVTAGELYGATLDPSGEVQIEDLPHVFVKTPRPGGHSVGYVHVMTFDFFAESFAPDLGKIREGQVS